MMFFQKGWKFLKGDIMKFMKEFYSNCKLGYGVNCSFVALIPEKENPTSLFDYRPIGLINSLYKVLSKVLANRLKQVLPTVIDKAQSAFVGGRSILDGVLIANEAVDWWKTSKKKGIILKLDFQKAYNIVNWNYLLQMLDSFGHGPRWIRWMKECTESVRISILVNGSPTAEFCPQKGLRQGDPLSPFLFNVVAEGLNILLSRAKELRIIKGVAMGNSEVVVSHLQFADNTIIFCEAERAEIVAIKRILRCFEMVAGLKINFHKSMICGVGVDNGLVEEFADIHNCQSHKLPLKYLGLPLGANTGRKQTWQPVVDRYKKKLSGWKRRLLSYAGRVTLIKAVLSSLPIYYMSLFKIPECVVKELDRIQARFLWGGD